MEMIHSPSLLLPQPSREHEELAYLEWTLPWCTFLSWVHRSWGLATSMAKATPPLLSLVSSILCVV